FSDFTFYGASFPTGEIEDNEAVRNRFEHLGGAAGRISLPYNAAPDEILGRIEIGDKLHVNWPTEHLPAGTGTAPDLTTPVTALVPVVVSSLTVTDINVDASIALVHVDVTIPSAQQAQWALLATYFGESPVTFPFARVTNLRELYAGPIFIDFEHPAPANDFEIVCNFVAPRGLVADDGVTTRRLNVKIGRAH